MYLLQWPTALPILHLTEKAVPFLASAKIYNFRPRTLKEVPHMREI